MTNWLLSRIRVFCSSSFPFPPWGKGLGIIDSSKKVRVASDTKAIVCQKSNTLSTKTDGPLQLCNA